MCGRARIPLAQLGPTLFFCVFFEVAGPPPPAVWSAPSIFAATPGVAAVDGAQVVSLRGRPRGGLHDFLGAAARKTELLAALGKNEWRPLARPLFQAAAFGGSPVAPACSTPVAVADRAVASSPVYSTCWASLRVGGAARRELLGSIPPVRGHTAFSFVHLLPRVAPPSRSRRVGRPPQCVQPAGRT